MSDILAKLKAPFPPSRISWRVGPTTQDKAKGQALAFIDARDVMERLDEVCGSFWGASYTSMHNGTCCCAITIKLETGEWVARSNGAVNLTDSDKADQKEMAEKGSYSDAFKRAAVLWGIGRYLYDLDSPWVPIVPAGRSYKFADGVRAQLDRMLAKGAETAPTPKLVPKQTALEKWGTDSVDDVGKFAEMKGLDNWLVRNEAAIKSLEEKHPATGEKLRMAIAAATEKLGKARLLAAG